MKRWISLFLALFLVLSVMPGKNVWAADYEYKATPLDQAWDWYTTLGKSGMEKERVLAENNAERLKRHAEKLAKQMNKDAGNAAADAKKKLGF